MNTVTKKTMVVAGIAAVAFSALGFMQPSAAAAASSWWYNFNSAGTLAQSASATQSRSQYLWLAAGRSLVIQNGIGATPAGTTIYQLFNKTSVTNASVQIDVNRVKDNLSNSADRKSYLGESIITRYTDANNYYYAGIRADGAAVIKKKVNGVYTTLAQKQVLPGTYSTTNYDLMPQGKWMSLKLVVADNAGGQPVLTFSTDIGRTGTWTQALAVTDTSAALKSAGLVGIQNDYADAQFDNFIVSDVGASVPTPTPDPTPTPTPTPTPSGNYDATVLNDKPVMYLAMNSFTQGTESDKTGRGHTGTYKGGTPGSATLPNGDSAADFNGTSQYLTVPSSSDLSIPTTKALTWEAWIRPDTLQFPVASGDGYIDWMGKCENYSPTCEWEARMYGASTAEGRPARLSAYVFNPSAGLGSAADWQPNAGVINSGQWVHVVAEYQTTQTPAGCNAASPGSINIWVNGVKQDMASHMPTGCMSQFSIKPVANNSPLDIGTMAMDTWFKGAIGKVAVYNTLLSQSQINAHYTAMTGTGVTGSCGATCHF